MSPSAINRIAQVLKDLSLDVRPGEVIGIVGKSGSGKSTLTKLIQRLYVPESGRVLVDGIDLAQVHGSGPSGRITKEDVESFGTPPPSPLPAAQRGGDAAGEAEAGVAEGNADEADDEQNELDVRSRVMQGDQAKDAGVDFDEGEEGGDVDLNSQVLEGVIEGSVQ